MPVTPVPLRVLYFIAYPQRLAGANRSLLELVTHLPPHVEPIVLLVSDGPVAEAYRRAGVRTQITPPGPALSTYGRVQLQWSIAERLRVTATEFLPYTWYLCSLFKQLRPDLVHANDPRGALLVGPATKLCRLPFVAHLRGGKPFGGMYWWPFEILPDRIITVCDAIRSDLAPWARRKSVAVYNGTTDISSRGGVMPWLAQMRRQGTLVVTCFASLTPFKGYHHLLHAAARLNELGFRERVMFLCVGDVVEHDRKFYDWLSRERERLGVDNMTFTGVQADPFAFYRQTDTSVLPSVGVEELTIDGETLRIRGTEGLPRTHLEAMCYGIPTIGTDLAGVREQILDGVTGFIVPPGDAAALTDAIERLLKDAALRERMGQAGRTRVLSKFTTDSYVHGVLDVYASVMRQVARAA